MKTISLNGIWNLRGQQQEGDPSKVLSLTAQVPGCVQLDLSREGHLPADLFMGNNILETEKYEQWQWWYERSFIAPTERENVWLVFEGVDCVAEYFINGQKLGESENMMIAHQFEVGKYLQDGENTLTVHIKSPVVEAHYQNYSLETMMGWHYLPLNGAAIRKPAHSYGWDIMPRAVTSGIWREVRLEIRDEIYFEQLYFHAIQDSYRVAFELNCKWQDMSKVELEVEGSCGDSSFSFRKCLKGGKAGCFPFEIENPKLWWPYGYGEPNVYDAVARIYREGVLIHEQKASFGIRSVVLERSDLTDGEHGKFRFLINGVEIMCKGSNWVPLDAFHSRDAERYDQALAMVKDIGCNILRCWGGNVYEDHYFFDFCDRNGIMVWQDFSMACQMYPLDERFAKLMEQEATAIVRKLRNHPSLILWAGDNEVDQMLMWRKFDPSINTITRKVLPGVINRNDFGRPYLPSSPYLSDAVYQEGHRRHCPEVHLWGKRAFYKGSYYKNDLSHFVSEIGHHGCPSLESIKKFISPDKVWPYQNNEEWILHSSDQNGNDGRVMIMEKQVREMFGQVPTEPESYILASQIVQAEAKKYYIERMRVGRPIKTGVIWWNLLDGWPQMSDAIVDYYFSKKVAYNYIKRCQAPFAVVAGEANDWEQQILACNDTLQQVSGICRVIDGQTDEVLMEKAFTAKANATSTIGTLEVYPSQQKILILQWEVDGKTAFNHYLCGHPAYDFETYCKIMKKYGL